MTNKLHLRRTRFAQRGYAMLAIITILGIAATTLVVTSLNSTAIRTEQDSKTTGALALAKLALIGRAAADDDRPGSLPCPDTNNDGLAELIVGNDCPSYIGRLPWRTLGLADLRDSNGERLWYALSSTIRDHSSAQPINSDTPGLLTVVGDSPVTNVVAIVFAPGRVLGTQIRDVANENNLVNYLEGENANGDSIYVTGVTSDAFNDRISAITSDELFQVVEYRVAGEIRASLAAYFAANHYYPFANSYADSTYGCTPLLTRGRIPNPGNYSISADCAGLADWPVAAQPPGWYFANNWHLLTYYTVAPACVNTTPDCAGAGFITVNNTPTPSNDKRALVIVAGRALGGQTRPCAAVTDCLEDAENTNADDIYVRNTVSTTFNDKFVIVAP
jgi:type II secretory pathway pseudopilin PulG